MEGRGVSVAAEGRLLSLGDTANNRRMSEARYARATPLLEAVVDEEIVALDRQQGEVFGFNRVASDVWRLLEEPKTFEELCRELQDRYDVAPDRCAEDTRDLLKELTELKLVRRIPEA